MTNARLLSSLTLTEGWHFKQTDDAAEDAWLSVQRVPTNVHLDLIEHGKYVSTILNYNCSRKLNRPIQNTRPFPWL
jgi:beta-mannosidase